MSRRQRIGLLGGAFSPIHNAHLQLAGAACAVLELDSVRFLPTGRPSHRSTPAVPFERRAHWVQLAIADRPDWFLDAREGQRPGPSYSVDTIDEYRREYPDADLCLIVGADAFAQFTHWHEWRRIAEQALIAVGSRPGSPALHESPAAAELPRWSPGRGERPAHGWIAFDAQTEALSSSVIRRQLEYGQDIASLVPEAVCRDIGEVERELLRRHD